MTQLERTGLDVGGSPVRVCAGICIAAAVDLGFDYAVAAAVSRGRLCAVAVRQAAADVVKAALGVRFNAREGERDSGYSENTSASCRTGFHICGLRARGVALRVAC